MGVHPFAVSFVVSVGVYLIKGEVSSIVTSCDTVRCDRVEVECVGVINETTDHFSRLI